MLVSVIMPVYKAEKTIRRAVESVLAQTMTDWELVIASDDHLDWISFLSNHGLSDPRLRQVATQTTASGPSPARNAGLAAASGQIIAPLDADDVFAPDRISQLLPLVQRSGCACDNVGVFSETGQLINQLRPGARDCGNILASEIMESGIPIQPVFHRDLLPQGWPGDLNFAEDVIVNLQLLSRAGAMPVHPSLLYHYSVHSESLCHRMDAWRMADAGYARILSRLAGGELELSQAVHEEALTGFEAKRQVNREFGAAYESGDVATFQEYIANKGKAMAAA